MRGVRWQRLLIAILAGALMVEVLAAFTFAAAADLRVAMAPSDAASSAADPGVPEETTGSAPDASTAPRSTAAASTPPAKAPTNVTQGPIESADPGDPTDSTAGNDGNRGNDEPASTPGATPRPTSAPPPPPTAAPPPPPPAPPPPPPPPPVATNCASGPPGEPAGWTRRVTSNFSETTAVGAWPGPVAARDWRNRQAGATDSSGRGVYHSGKTVSEHNGVVDIFIHSEGNTRYVAAIVANLGDTVGQRINVCMRADRIPGYKLVFMLWPGTGNGNQLGEIDYPEGKLTPEGVANAFMHYSPKPASGQSQDAYNTGMWTQDWHVYTIEWDPGSSAQTDDYAAFYVDGRLIGRSTGANVPDGPMHYLIQTETYVGSQALPPPASGHVLIDWITISTPN